MKKQYLTIIFLLTVFIFFGNTCEAKPTHGPNFVPTNNEEQAQQQEQQTEQDKNDNGNQVQNQENKQTNGEEHRSKIATVVQNLLSVADLEPGEVGDKIREVAQQQNESKDGIADAMDKVNNRNGLKTFLIGIDYKNVGQLRSEIAKIGNQIDQLNRLLDKTTTDQDKTTIQEQIKTLEEQQQKINDIVKNNESKFSLFGWFVKLFNK